MIAVFNDEINGQNPDRVFEAAKVRFVL